jgi:plastocyanin
MKLTHTLGAAAAAALISTLAVAIDGNEAPANGTITGKIVFDGKLPEVKPLAIKAEQAKGCCADDETVSDVDRSLVVDKDGGIAYVVVTLEVAGEERDVEELVTELDQRKCRFEPHVVVVPAGSSIAYANSDSISHNIHTYAIKNESLNKAVPAGTNLKQKLEKPEAVKIACDIHPWMTSYVYVTDENRWAVSGTDGKFEIKDVPPGTYKLTIWHERLGREKAEVTVGEDGTSEPVEVKLSEEKKGGTRRRR